MSEEEQEKLYELLFKDTKNKLEATIEKLRIANTELRDELDKKNSEIEKQQKEIEEINSEFAINTEIHKRDMKIKELEEVNNCLHESSKELFISKDKIKSLLKQVNTSIGHFKASDSNNIILRVKKRLEELLEENNKCK